jgi:S1-C subfamily serine protease
VLSRQVCRSKTGLVRRTLAHQMRRPMQRRLGSTDRYAVFVGSGFFVSRDGALLTNNHVAQECDALFVQSGDDRTSRAAVVKLEPATDMALIRTNLRPSAVAAFRSGPPLHVGEEVLAAGYPRGGAESSRPVFSKGNISWLPRGSRQSMTISARLQPGNSGGPLLDRSGNVVGVNFLIEGNPEDPAITDRYFAIQAGVAEQFLQRQRIRILQRPSKDLLESQDVAQRASRFTARVFCLRQK